MSNRLTITAPDDWHLHLRDGEVLRYTVGHAAANFRRAIIMPNLLPPVTKAADAEAYRQRILALCPKNTRFEPLMVLYLTDNTSPADIKAAKQAGVVACKLYPAGATTNSDSGVTDITKLNATLEVMQQQGLRLLVHGEVTQEDIDIFDREAVFIERVLNPLMGNFPELKIVLEHISTREAADFVREAPPNLAATITAHHLLFNRNHLLAGGIRPHYYCLPILKRQSHQQALLRAATSGNPKFFLGTDSAPHAKSQKETACGCAGSYTAFAPLSLYAEAFESAAALDKLEAFASFYGPDFYGLSRNSEQVTLVKNTWTVPGHFDFGGDQLVPIKAGEILQWQVLETSE